MNLGERPFRDALREKCRQMRKAATPAEAALWEMLRNRRLDALKFRRQHAFGPYILDFYCPECRLAVEADGKQHLTRQGQLDDANRDAYFREQGIRVLRFSNEQILKNPFWIRSEIRRLAFSSDAPEPLPTAKAIIEIDRSFYAPSPFRADTWRCQELRPS